MGRINEVKRQIFREIQKENGGTMNEIEEIVEAQFAFVQYQIAKGEFSQVRLPYLGKFFVKPYRLSKVNHAAIQRNRPPGRNRPGATSDT